MPAPLRDDTASVLSGQSAAVASDSAPATSVRARSAAAPRSALVTTIRCGISTMPAFMNCSESPEPGWTQNTTVSATPDIGLGLADAHGLDQDAVEQRAHHDHGGQRLVGQSTEPVARRHGAHEAALVARIVDDAHAVSQQCAAARLGRGIDRDHAHGPAVLAP